MVSKLFLPPALHNFARSKMIEALGFPLMRKCDDEREFTYKELQMTSKNKTNLKRSNKCLLI
ncbi:MAG: hypothetical protein LBQ18_00205 [Campylobacteraceae bacterium]|nr:hypothetical protein [Campylobacteraceae bacterium]